MNHEALRKAAQNWKSEDPDPLTQSQITAMLARNDTAELHDHFGGRLQFGTAGIRGKIGPGPRRMNRALIRRVTAGLGNYLLQHPETGSLPSVVIGYDGRHGSQEFAEDAARVLGGKGFQVHRFETVCATPALAHAVVFLEASAGIMVTASHNPPQDNGYKVYWNNGAQIVPPHDRGISDEIDRIDSIQHLSMPSLAEISHLVKPVTTAIWQDYLKQVLGLRVHHNVGATAVYTAMHGVGWPMIRDVLKSAGHQTPLAVPEQRDPDGDFPTVAFPNPEEPGALDLALDLAKEHEADLIIANDPDADRLAVAVPGPSGWKMLTGNQIGLLLAEDLLSNGPKDGQRMVSNTIVSSSMLGDIARAHQAKHVETLTGFKWIANAALAHDGPFVIGFEEALGYSVGPVVRDKDGVSAALLIMDLASHAKAQGQTLLDRLEALYRKYGFIASAQHACTLPGDAGADQIREIMAELRDRPPSTIGGSPVVEVRDIEQGIRTNLLTGEISEETLPKSNVLSMRLDTGERVLARPSGTEPKIKFYFEARVQMEPNDPLEQAEARANTRIQALKSDLIDVRFPALSR